MLASGLKAWVVQRLSAVYLSVFIFWMAGHFWFDPPKQYQDWVQWLAHPYIAIAVGLFFLSLVLHAWVGVRDVIMDYISSIFLRSLLLVTVILFLLAMFFWSLRIIFNIEYQ